jgi:5-methylthioadenosine/S-adenosylhomocysteine deaminase
MRQTVLLQCVRTQQPTVSNGEVALELAARSGAEYLGIEAGYLAPGRLADVAVVDASQHYHPPRHRTLAALVYASSPADVQHTIVGGRVIVDNGRCAQVDENEVAQETGSRAADLIERAGLASLLEPWRFGLIND